ncbi:hypothetical protein BCR35DRAFT_351597 [Leucosporidium creatinivorum]|uniref:Uncharacterized protein n=1 Tax=Leucosporidium creatinivorum TaxID=106004 RepID=A0A1Y2FPX8_9BASI|nr:hypothetical protein BCR35DRAFT_351597 [Leucosporidium creatinivorum]
MFAASARFRPRLALRSAQPAPLSLAFSTTAPAGKGRISRAHGSRNDGRDSTPRPSAATTRTHRLAPHRNALTDWRLLFHTRTRWIARTLAQGKWIPPKLLSNILVNRHIPVQQLTLWVDVLSKRDLYEAMERLGLLESGGEGRERVEFPDWLFLSLPGLLRSADQAPYLASMLGSPRYQQLSQHQQGLFISRCIQNFLKLGHYVAVRETVEWVCYHERQLTSAQTFTRCLSALASHRSSAYGLQGPPYELLSSLTRLLRSTMARRGIKPVLEVFRALFRPALIPREPKEVARLVLEMEQAGFAPKRRILHQAMTVYARAGDVAGAEMFQRQIVGGEAEEVKEAGEAASEEGEEGGMEPRAEPGIGVYGTTRLRAFGDDIKAAFAYFDLCLQTPHHRSLPGALPPLFDGVTWSTLFHIASSSPTFSSQDLLNVLRKLEKASSAIRTKEDDTRYIPPRPSLFIYHSVMIGLLRRQDPRLVVNLWVSLRARGLEPDNHLLDAVLRAYLALDDPRSALSLLDHYAYKPSEHPPLIPAIRHRRLPRGTSPPPTPIPNTLQLDVVPLNNLLHYYNRTGYTFNCYRLFLKMQSTYGVQPDAATLSILIDAARYSSAAAGLGFGPGSEAINVSGVRGKGQEGVPDDLWGDESKGGKKEHAWKVAERLCWEVLEGNWPEGVERVKDPMEGGGVVNWLLGRGGEADPSPSGQDDMTPSDTLRSTFPATLSLVNPPSYPHLYPNERVFRSFIQLLGYHSSARDIPLVLAWMRYIGIKPSRHTLTLAMLYVGELGLEERKMVRWRIWLRDWLGEEEVPLEEEVAFVRRGGGKAGKPIRR